MKWLITIIIIIIMYSILAYIYYKKTNKNLFDSILGIVIKVKWTGGQIDILKKWFITNNMDSSSEMQCFTKIITENFTYAQFQDIAKEADTYSQNNNPPSDLLTNFMSVLTASNCESK